MRQRVAGARLFRPLFVRPSQPSSNLLTSPRFVCPSERASARFVLLKCPPRRSSFLFTLESNRRRTKYLLDDIFCPWRLYAYNPRVAAILNWSPMIFIEMSGERAYSSALDSKDPNEQVDPLASSSSSTRYIIRLFRARSFSCFAIVKNAGTSVTE